MIHSLQNAYEMASKDDAGNPSFMDHFSCKICLEILNQPVQCQRNEHYYCTLCITKHLEQSHTCPLCQEELTVETLRPVPRVVAEVVSQFKIPRCNNVHRGCKEVVKPEDLPLHHEVCCFAPVVCSNEGCGETVNRQDQSSHENESCKFRKVKCELCEEEMPYRDHKMHRCFMRKEMDEVKSCLTQVRDDISEMRDCLKKFQEQMNINSQFIKDLKNPVRNVSPSSLIFLAHGNSLEIFNWSTKTWTLHEDILFYPRQHSFCFPYKNSVMVCGGECSNRIEYLNIKKDPITSHTLPVSLPEYRLFPGGNGTLCGSRILTFENSEVREIVLEPPRPSKVVASLAKYRNFYGVEYFNGNIIILGGGSRTKENYSEVECLDTVLSYNTSTNEVKQLATLPYEVSKMATVLYKDNVIVLGGEDQSGQPLNSVIMYNITKEESQKLPSMLQKRSGCTAVIMEDVIVVMGGHDESMDRRCNFLKRPLKTVEYYVLGQDSWSELPPMHCGRVGATACVQE